MDLERGNTVIFSANGTTGIKGTVEIIDRFGGGVYDGKCATIDVMGEDGVFYKHIPIHNVERI